MANILEVYSYNQHFVAMMNIINAAKLNKPAKGHKHHIIPRCWFKLKGIDIDNSKDNIVLLSEEEHLKVHKLAILCAKDSVLKSKLGFAVHRLHGSFSGMHHTEATKAIIKEKRKNQIITEESKKKRSLTLKGRKKPPRSEEHKQHLRDAAKGRHWKLVEGKRVWWYE